MCTVGNGGSQLIKKDEKLMDKILIGLLVFLLIIGALCGTCYLLNEKNYKDMIEYIDTFKAEPTNRVEPQKDEYGNWYFTTDEDFKVLHLTDIHITGGFANKKQDKMAINAVAAMVPNGLLKMAIYSYYKQDQSPL